MANISNKIVGFSSTYFLQKALRRRLPYSTKLAIAISTVIGTSATYKITKDSLNDCKSQNLNSLE